MTHRFDLPPERDLPPGRLFLRKEHLMSEIHRSSSPIRKRGGKRVVALVTSGILLVAASAFAATRTTVGWTEQPDLETGSVGCYKSVSPESEVIVVENSAGQSPVEVCGGIWNAADSGTDQRSVACSTGQGSSGPVSVFPTSDSNVCGTFGLRALPADYGATTRAFSGLREAIIDRIGFDPPCPDATAARNLIRVELDSRGLTNWSVEIGQGQSGDFAPCALVGLDFERKAALLHPGARMTIP